MNFDLIGSGHELLRDHLEASEPQIFDPLACTRDLAKSVFQKAIRRDEAVCAFQAAATLIQDDARQFWRRLVVTILEDLGPGQLNTLICASAVLQGHEYRSSPPLEWEAAGVVLKIALDGTRDQIANDAYNLAVHSPALSELRSELAANDEAYAVAVVTNHQSDVLCRTAAILRLLGDAPFQIEPDARARGRADLWSILRESSPAASVYEFAFSRTRLALAPISCALMAWGDDLHSIEIRDDEIPPASWAGNLPLWSADQYTRAGRRALLEYVKASSRWQAFATNHHIAEHLWTAAAGEILFRAEGALLKRRATYPANIALAQQSAPIGCFMAEEAVPEARALVRSELPLIDQLRSRYLHHLAHAQDAP